MTNADIRALFEEFRTALESKLRNFEFDVEMLYDVGEYEAAILAALMRAGHEGVPVADDLIERSAELFSVGGEHILYVDAVNRIRAVVTA